MNFNEMKIALKREIKYKAYLVQADIGTQKPAGLFTPVVKLAKLNSNFLTEELISKEFEFSIPMTKRVIQRCLFKGLIEEDKNTNYYHLTEAGEETANENLIFEKESGEYRLFITDDPLIPQKVLTIQRVDKNYHLKKRDSLPSEKLDISLDNKTFQNLLPEKDEIFTSFINSDKILIKKCYEIIFQEKDSNLDLFLNYTATPSNEDFRLDINFNTKNNKINKNLTLNEINPEFSFSLVLLNLLKQKNLLTEWYEKNKILKVPFDLKSKRQVNYRQFFETIILERPKIVPFGDFETVQFQIPIGPKNSEECLKWEKFLLLEKINEICFSNQYLRLKNECENIMEKNGKTWVELPNQNDLINELRKENEKTDPISQEISYGPRSDKYWFLQAALDLEINF